MKFDSLKYRKKGRKYGKKERMGQKNREADKDVVLTSLK